MLGKDSKKSSRIYDTLKWMVQVVSPAGIVLYTSLSTIWNWEYREEVVATGSAVTAFVGVLLGISSIQYVNKHAPHLKQKTESRDDETNPFS